MTLIPYTLQQRVERILAMRCGITTGADGIYGALSQAGLLRRDEPCHCGTPGLNYAGPEEDCPLHGRPYAEWVGMCAAAEVERDALRANAARVRAVMDEWNMFYDSPFCEEFGETINESGAWRFARDMRAAIQGEAS